MTSSTQHYNLTKLDPTESIHSGRGRFASDDRDTIDQALYNAVQHKHVGSTGSNAPATPLTLSLSTTGGTIPAATTVRYKYTFTDPLTGETQASPETVVTTPDPLIAPSAPTASLQSIGGTLEPGQYFYVLTAYQGASTVETKALNPLAILVPAGTSTNEVTLNLPTLPAGATGFNVYRRAPNEARYSFLASTADATYVDGGVVSTSRSIPTHNTTSATNSITVTVGESPASGQTWTLYRSYSADFTSSRLVGLTSVDTTYTDIGANTQSASPPSASITNPSKIQLTGGAEVQGVLPKTMMEGGGVTDLTWNVATSTVVSSTGTDAPLTAATGTNAGLMAAADKTKLDGVEVGATGDMTSAEIKTAYESNVDTNAFTDAEKTKLSGVAAGATAVTAGLTTVAATGPDETLTMVAAPNEGWVEATMDQNCTFTLAGATTGAVYRVRLILTGAFTPTFVNNAATPVPVTWTGGVAPTYAAPTIYEFVTTDGGATIYGSAV